MSQNAFLEGVEDDLGTNADYFDDDHIFNRSSIKVGF